MSCHAERSLVDVLRASVARHPQKAALQYYGKKISYQQLYDSARRFAGFLLNQIKRDIHVGSRIGLLMLNFPQYPIAYFGAMMAGCVPVPLDFRDDPKRIRQVIKKTTPRLIVAALREYNELRSSYVQEKKKKDPSQNLDQGILDFSKNEADIVGVDAADYFGFWKRRLYRLNPFKKFTYDYRWNEAMKAEPLTEDKFRYCETALLQSADGPEGREGRPVIAELTHQQLLANIEQVKLTLSQFIHEKSILSSPLPLTHVYGLTTCLHAPLAVGGKIILSQEMRPKLKFLRMLQEERITVFVGTSKMYDLLLMACRDLKEHKPEPIPIGEFSLELCISGERLILPDRKEELVGHLGLPIYEGHGLAEVPVISLNLPGASKEGSLGKLMPRTEGMMVEGNLFIRGPQLMSGYYKDEEGAGRVMAGGWLNLGNDIVLDEENFLIPKDPQNIRTCIADNRKKA